eukprot:4206335-Prymnesium_polylepis.1
MRQRASANVAPLQCSKGAFAPSRTQTSRRGVHVLRARVSPRLVFARVGVGGTLLQVPRIS